MASKHNIAKPIADPGITVNEAVVQGKTATLIRGDLSGIAPDPVSGALAGVIQLVIRQSRTK